MAQTNVRRGPGRPPKYGRPSRAVTLTLPEEVLARLRTVDPDIGRAIVNVVDRRRLPSARALRTAEVASYGNHAVIIVTPIRALKRLAGVELIPIGAGRALISLESPRSVSQLELNLRDALDQADGQERQTLEAIADILGRARRSRSISLEERTIIVLQSRRQRDLTPAAGTGTHAEGHSRSRKRV